MLKLLEGIEGHSIFKKFKSKSKNAYFLEMQVLKVVQLKAYSILIRKKRGDNCLS